MKLPTWPLAAAALGGLLLLVALSVLTLSRKAQDIYTELDQLNTHHRNVDTMLRRLRADVHLSGIYIRDYLLDNARENAPEYRRHLEELRTSNLESVQKLRSVVRPEDRARVVSLEGNLNEYWQTFDPLFDWTVVEKIVNSARFLRREVLPRREAVLALAQEIEQLNNTNLGAQRAEVMKRQEQFRSALHSLLWQSLLLGLVVALTAVARLRAVERRSDIQRTRAETAEGQMRQLSQQLVATQEEERRKLSRELHDHVGQMLTALRLEVGGLERMRTAPDGRFTQAVAECKSLVETMLRTVRDLALGLRPEHAGRSRSSAGARMARPRLPAALQSPRRAHRDRRSLGPSRSRPHLRLPHRPGSAHQLRAACEGGQCRHLGAVSTRTELEVSVVDDGVGFDPADAAARAGTAGDRGTRPRAAWRLHGSERARRTARG